MYQIKKIFIVILPGFMFSMTIGNCVDIDSLSNKLQIGLVGGFGQNNSFNVDLFTGLKFREGTNPIWINYGYSFFDNLTNYRGVDNLKFYSHGIYIESNYYLKPKFYTGVRFSLNFNWIDRKSQEKFKNIPSIESPTFFSAITLYGQFGYYQVIGKKSGLKFQGQLGIHNYQIAEGWLLIDNSGDDFRNAQYGIERHMELLYNINLGIIFML